MGVGSSLKVITAGVAWRTVGAESAGDTLLHAFGSGDEQDRTLAGISIVKAGERSINLIEKARSGGRLTPSLVRLLADIGGPKSRGLLAEIATGSGPMAAAAYESLDLLDQIDGLGAPE
ncbi:MAG: hypothetical protein WEE53_06515 [Acidimicrobiia bacterium]